MAKHPELSIIIPAYNCQLSVSRLINHITSQSYKGLEVIIVDDCSTDNTAKILDELATKDQRIKIIHQQTNGGASLARNTGIKEARGRYLMFLDADDDITDNTIKDYVSAMQSNQNVQLVVSGFKIISLKDNQIISRVESCVNSVPQQQTDEPWRLYILRLLGLDGRLYQVWNKIYLASIIKDNNLQFQVGINFGEDLLFNLDYYAHMTGCIKFITQPLYIYYQSLDSGTFSKSSLIYANRQQNYNYLRQFMAAEFNSSYRQQTIDLMIWIKFNWIYSHLLAVCASSLSHQHKVANINEVAKINSHLKPAGQSTIGKRRYRIEKLLRFLIRHPNFAIIIIGTSNIIKTNQLTARLWRGLRDHINS